jgi:uroporphyrinogen decarboxylase
MTNLMEYFYTEPGFVEEVFERITEFHLGLARHFVKVGARSAGFSDDLAMQTGPFFGPDVLERFFKPCYKRIFDFYSEHDVLVGQHSCGKVEDLLDFFMDVGLSSLHPVQVSANDLVKVRAKTQGRLALHGGISNVTITNGPVEAIEEEVKRHMWLLGREGGYFCQIDHSMPAPDEHRAAFHEAVEKFGRYPLQKPESLGD